MAKLKQQERKKKLLEILDDEGQYKVAKEDWHALYRWLDLMADGFIKQCESGDFPKAADKKGAQQVALLILVAYQELERRLTRDDVINEMRMHHSDMDEALKLYEVTLKEKG